jgi:hypothetical protein
MIITPREGEQVDPSTLPKKRSTSDQPREILGLGFEATGISTL